MVIKGSIVLINFPFTDLSQTKLRPAVILWLDPDGSDVIVCAISSQNVDNLTVGEFRIRSTDIGFAQTGLRTTSKVRTTRIATLDRQLLVRKLGDLSKQYIQQLNQQLLQSFQLM